MNLFPFINPPLDMHKINEFPLYRELAWDFKKNEPIVENGEFKIVDGIDAIKVWCYLAIKTNRYQYPIYSWDYGSEIMELIGKPYTKALIEAECEKYIKEALLINPYINTVTVINSEFDGSLLNVNVKLDTIYGEGEVSF